MDSHTQRGLNEIFKLSLKHSYLFSDAPPNEKHSQFIENFSTIFWIPSYPYERRVIILLILAIQLSFLYFASFLLLRCAILSYLLSFQLSSVFSKASVLFSLLCFLFPLDVLFIRNVSFDFSSTFSFNSIFIHVVIVSFCRLSLLLFVGCYYNYSNRHLLSHHFIIYIYSGRHVLSDHLENWDHIFFPRVIQPSLLFFVFFINFAASSFVI